MALKICHDHYEKWKRAAVEELELNLESIRTLGEKENSKYLEIREIYTIKQAVMKGGKKKTNIETKLCDRNLIKGLNTWVILLVRYSGLFLKWTRDELRQMEQRSRKLVSMEMTLRARHVSDRFYVSRKGGRGLPNNEDCVDVSIQGVEDKVKKNKERRLTAASNNIRSKVSKIVDLSRG